METENVSTAKKPDMEWKIEHLYRMFSHRTRNKERENYIINAIWQKLDTLELEPVTQQCVHTEGGTYRLIDLYFPQLNVGVECDEEFHNQQKDQDKQRELDIFDVLSACEESGDYLPLHVNAGNDQSAEMIHAQIDDVVKKIRERVDQRKKAGIFKKWTKIDIWEEIKRIQSNGVLSIRDTVEFPTIADACNCFRKEAYRGMQKSYFHIGLGYQIWFPQLALEQKNQLKDPSGKGWINTLSDDGKTLKEYNTQKATAKDSGAGRLRITFAKSRNLHGKTAYRFIGVFSYMETIKENGKRIKLYQRIDNNINIRRFLDDCAP